MKELVKKELVTPSLDTTLSSRLVTLEARKASRSSKKKKPIISSPTSRNLAVLEVHTASSSSIRTSSDSEKEKPEKQVTSPKKIWISKFRGKEFSRTFHRKRIVAKYYRKQKLKNADSSYKKKQPPIPKASGKCFKCGKRGHLNTKCKNKDGTLINISNELVSTSTPKIQAVVPEVKSTKPKKEVTVNDLQKEIKETYSEVQTLKESLATLRIDHNQRLRHWESTLHQNNKEGLSLQNPYDADNLMVQENFLETINRINFQKWHSKVRIVINKEFEFEVIALIDSGADLNCIQEGIIPSKYFKQTRERLTSASDGKMQIEFKIPKAHVCQDNICFKTTFVLVKNMTDRVILGNPFMCLLYPFTVDGEGITTQPFGQSVKFKFLRSPEPREISTLQDISVSKTLNLISAKIQHLDYLKDDLRYTRVEEQLACKNIQDEIRKFEEKLKQEICSDLPTAFWHRKRHEVALPYVKDFNEKDIPTKARPIQMNHELMDICKAEIEDLHRKGTIRNSRSPWSCPAFYVQKNAEIERGVPWLIINYKPLNKVLEWVRYPIPNKKDLVNRLDRAVVFSKFDMKSGF